MIPEEETELEDAIYEINTILEPEDGGSIDIANEIKEGEDLEFTVTVNEGYALPIVSVNGDEIEANEEDLENAEFSYFVSDIYSDTDTIDINVMFMPSNELFNTLEIQNKSLDDAELIDVIPGTRKDIPGSSHEKEWNQRNTHNWYFVVEDENGDLTETTISGIDLRRETEENCRILVDERIAEINPEIIDGTVYLAHRYALEKLGWGWHEVPDTAIIEYFALHIGQPTLSQSAYFYIKKAEFAVGSGSSETAGSDPANYEYWGTGSVPLLSAGDMIREIGLDKKQPLGDFEWTKYDNLFVIPDEPQGTPDTWYQDEDWNEPRRIMDSEGYPILYLDNSDGTYTAYYHEDSNDAEKGTDLYSIEWSVISIARGAVGADHETSLTEDEYTYHIDGEVSLRSEDKIELNASWQKPEEAGKDPNFADETKYSSQSIMIPTEGNASEVWEEFRDTLDIDVPEGYELVWYFDQDGKEEYNSDTLNELAQAEGTNGIKLYGIFVSDEVIPDKHTLTYHANNGTDNTKSEELDEGM